MTDVTVIGVFDSMRFPTKYHAILEGSELPLCGLSLDPSKTYEVSEHGVTCAACSTALAEAVQIEEPVEYA